ncbi:MAG: hypothetical protein EBR82_50120 [Caulobacteraceae bacterium]|nr:hypothetical protein [Caulobacteraceae bacterium]
MTDTKPRNEQDTPRLAAIYAAGAVRRWHANPDMADCVQTIADHQGRCVQLLALLHPAPSADLLIMAAFHDQAERWVGDLPGPFKRAHRAVAEAHAAIEARILRSILHIQISQTDQQWLGLVDRLEAYAFMAFTRPRLTFRPDWRAVKSAILDSAAELGCAVEVGAMIDDLQDMRW